MAAKFFAWHYSQGIKNIAEIYTDFARYFWEHFSVWRFIKTLFSPWRRDVSRVGQRGLHPILFLQALVENIFTRIIGSIVRMAVIIFAVIVEVIVFVIAVFILIVWIAFPLVLLASLGEIAFSLSSPDSFFPVWISLFGLSLLMVIASLRAFRRDIKDYFSMDIIALSRERWFSRALRRIGVADGVIDEAILADPEKFDAYLKNLDMTREEFSFVISWEMTGMMRKENDKKFWLRENLEASQPVGHNWTYAYTVGLDRYSRDLSEGDYSEYRNAELVGLEKELSELRLILTRPSQNSVILIGEAGVGRDTIIHALAKEIRENRSTPELANKRILELSLKEALSDAKGGRSEEKLRFLFREAAGAGNVILVLRDIDNMLSEDSGNGRQDISVVLGDYLESPSFQIIGTVTPDAYHQTVEKKERVMKYCDHIMVPEMSKENTMTVLFHKLRKIEGDNVLVTYQAVREIVEMSDRYISDSPFPEKALDMLEEVILNWSNDPGSPMIGKEAVDRAVSQKIKVPLGEVTGTEGEKLLDLEKILHGRVIGQNMAVDQIAQAVRRSRVGMVQSDKPLGSFLFLGPTGVGKTESAKALAEAYFGDEERMIRLDMSEYQTPDSIDRMIGSPATGQEGYLVSRVKENPHALLLIDEIEKAYPAILNLFLQILDEGHLTDAFGKKINFKNLIIIATSNAGSDVIKESIDAGMGQDEIHDKLINYVIEKGIFKTELLNRFGGVIFFHPLAPDEISQVTKILLLRHAGQIKKQENIDITFAEGVSEVIAERAFDPVFGARAISRYIQDKIEDNLAKKIISGEIKKGGGYEFQVADVE